MKAICALLTVGLSASALAGNFWTAQEFVAAYNEGGSARSSALGYAMAVADDVELREKACLPSNATAGQVAAVAIKHIEAHPEYWNWPASALIFNSYTEAWPCPKK